ncbi:MAG: ribonuclease D [Chloroflexi bacterium]|nr:ribonuclease D [Chloroflexota bacterium]
MIGRRSSLPPATYIDHPKKLDAMVEALRQEPLLGIDTESNSLHVYHERVCLIQISSRAADYIIDPLALTNLNPLGNLFADPRIEKVFHASEYDLMCLKRDYQMTISNLFDTMQAARICGVKQIGLNHLVQAYLGIELDKSHQRDNWGRRPLAMSSLRYAQLDTHYLPELHDLLLAELEVRGHAEEARETFEDLSRLTPAHEGRSFDEDGFWKIGQPARLNGRQMAILREVYLSREALAEKADIPPMNVVQNRTLIELAQRQPADRDQLRDVFGLSPNGLRKYGDAFLAAVARGKDAPIPKRPDAEMTPPDIADRYTALHGWRRKRAEARGVESDVIVTKQTLWSLAFKAPTTLDQLENIQGLGPWRLNAYGPEILAVIAKNENGAKPS